VEQFGHCFDCVQGGQRGHCRISLALAKESRRLLCKRFARHIGRILVGPTLEPRLNVGSRISHRIAGFDGAGFDASITPLAQRVVMDAEQPKRFLRAEQSHSRG
jgi:hypothetical protein